MVNSSKFSINSARSGSILCQFKTELQGSQFGRSIILLIAKALLERTELLQNTEH
jgi:hypothetical protein